MIGNKIKKITKVTLETIANVISVILSIFLIILIYNVIQIKLFSKSYMDILGYSIFQVKTGSMSGTLEIGDIIIVKLTKEVNEEEIITYEKEGILITHRIIKKDDGKIITKGDSNNTEDAPVMLDEVVGKVVYTFKNIEVWEKVFKTPEVIILIIITLFLAIISTQIQEPIGYKNIKKNNNGGKDE